MRFVYFISTFLVFSCLNEPDCLITASDIVHIKFVNDENEAFKLNLDSVRVLGTDTVYYKASMEVVEMQLPLNPRTNESEILIYRTDETEKIRDTLIIQYNQSPRLLSRDCGAFIFYDHLKVKKKTFDSVRVVNPNLFTTVLSNVEIVF